MVPIRIFSAKASQLAINNSGSIAVEFALTAPVLLIMMIGGLELSNFAITKMRVQQLALQVADNASRIGEGSLNAALRINEGNINDVLAGAEAQAGDLNVFKNYNEKINGSTTVKGKGRVIISSLEPMANPNTSGKYKIGWQRCKGNLTSYTPQYGTAGQASGTNMTGMGPTGGRVIAPDGTAIMFVEVSYRYEPFLDIGWKKAVFGTGMDYQSINAISAMMVRDDRDTSQVYPKTGITASNC
jgi:Flp pilus assembly protein TadG